jgi:hypothetical protein
VITAPIRIDFTEPLRLHASDDGDGTTVFDVAAHLEMRYSVIKTFIALHKKNIERILSKEIALAFKHGKNNAEMDASVAQQIQNEWRAYILNEEHGISTRASRERGDPSFVDTQDYFLSLEARVIHE